jgi:hypothetical protein
MKRGSRKGNSIIHNLDGTSTIVIPSVRHGMQYVLVDTADAELAAQHTWCVGTVRGDRMYAMSAIRKPNNVRTTLYLHSHIMGGSDHSIVVDHIDHNGLNCCRHNLRLVPSYINTHNAVHTPRGYFRRGKRYVSNISIRGNIMRVGIFDTPEEAHAAYLAARITYGVAI